MSLKKTAEGHEYEVGDGVSHGLPCDGAITPASNMAQGASKTFDAIIIGAGFAGLTAARDLTLAGCRVLLLEGRDRIGGRTWTSNVDGHLYEMGGTWIHWEQPHVYREMARYNLHRDFVVTSDATDQPRSVSVDDDGELHQLTLETFDRLSNEAFEVYCNVDGEQGKATIPFPHDSLRNTDARRYESLAVADRLEQVRDSLTKVQICILKGLIEGIVGHQDFANVGFFDVLRWWALSGYTTAGLYDFTEVYKIKQGQTHFSLQFFKECLASQRLSYVFKARVASVSDKNGSVTATLSDGRQFRGHRLISTLPLNVLREVKFDPPLSTARDEAARIGQVHNGAKIHFKIGASETRPLSTLRYSKSRIVSTLGDGRTESNGCRHMVAFGRNDASLSTVDDARSFYSEAREAFPNMPVEKVLWHDWSRDEFAKGGWCMYRPDFAFRYLEALRKREGNVLFANADWALGWRGFIDGAIEEGTRVAFEVKNELAASLVTKAHL
ncbi:Monoamine oxidase N [Fusarium oxysporum f. sp. narcissi]|uniref:Amine oxidase n=1 Tax=Fusarium oxysporum f. sp. narcissi TaxID=451672 RepID=A0A4Q2VHQ1_FUSOX|nr:Monoamine oxidase N [Fusarium oxysporum f. sp. narcissi]